MMDSDCYTKSGHKISCRSGDFLPKQSLPLKYRVLLFNLKGEKNGKHDRTGNH